MASQRAPRTVRVFVSYSHDNREWIDGNFGLIKFLEESLRELHVQFDYDRMFASTPGDEYVRRINEWIDGADFAILLLSHQFSSSEFIRVHELPRILERQEARAAPAFMIPIIIENIDWDSVPRLGYIKDRYVLLPECARPLIEEYDLSRPGAFARAKAEILHAVSSSVAKLRSAGAGAPEQRTSPIESVDDAVARISAEARASGLTLWAGPAAFDQGDRVWCEFRRLLLAELGRTQGCSVCELVGLCVDALVDRGSPRSDARSRVVELLHEAAGSVPMAPWPEVASLPACNVYSTMWGSPDLPPHFGRVLDGCQLSATTPALAPERELVYVHGALNGPTDRIILSDTDRIELPSRAATLWQRIKQEMESPRIQLCVGIEPDDLLTMKYLFRARRTSSPTSNLQAVFHDVSVDDARRLQELGVQAISMRAGEVDASSSARAFLSTLLAALEGKAHASVRPARRPSAPPSARSHGMAEADLDRSVLRLTRSGSDWFENWPAGMPTPRVVEHLPLPPLLKDDVYVLRGIEQAIRRRLEHGGNAAITGVAGIGGVGKTYLALRLASELQRDGWQVAWVGLLQQRSDQALDAVAQAFGMRFHSTLTTPQKARGVNFLLGEAARQCPRTLVVLDNAERFPDLPLLLGALSTAYVLITSRVRECPEQLHYFELESMNPEQSLELARKVFDARGGVKLRPDDWADLGELFRHVGGHALAIRMICGGYLRLSAVERQRPRPFKKMMNDLKAKGLRGIPVGAEIDSGRAGESLHMDIETTFHWLYDDLPELEHGIPARLLLPLVAALGATPVSMELLARGTAALGEVIDIASKSNTLGWATAFQELTSPDGLMNALSVLNEVSLVDADDGLYRIHPLVREFALDERYAVACLDTKDQGPQVMAPSGPTLNAYLRAAQKVLGDWEQHRDAFLDLIPRFRADRETALRFCQDVIAQQWEAENRKWQYDLVHCFLTECATLASSAGLVREQGIVLLLLGEHRNRMGEPDGRALIQQGLRLLPAPFRPAEHAHIIWAEAYLNYDEQLEEIGDLTSHIRATLSALRRLLPDGVRPPRDAAISTWEDALAAHVGEGPQDAPLGLSALTSGFLSNCLGDLRKWLSYSARLADGLGQSRIDEAVRLFELARTRAAGSSSSDAVVDLGVVVSFRAALLAWRDRLVGMSDAEVGEEQARIRELCRTTARFAMLLRPQELSLQLERAVRKSEWALASELAHRLLETDPRATLSVLDDRVLATVAELATEKLTDSDLRRLTNEVELEEEDARKWGHNPAIGWLCLSLALLTTASATDGKAARGAVVFALQSRRAFLRHVPALTPLQEGYYRRVVERVGQGRYEHIRETVSSQQATPPDFRPWLLARKMPLPVRVRSKSDGRAMRLVEGGLVRTPEGLSRWMYPFYLDEAPVTAEQLGLFLASRGELSRSGEGAAIGMSQGLAREYASWAGKHLPTAMEWHASRAQLEFETQPEVWRSWDDALPAMLGRTRAAIEGKLDDVDWDCMSTDVKQAGDRELIEMHFSSRWITDLRDLYAIFKASMVQVVDGIVSRDARMANVGPEEFCLRVLNSISLDLEEKTRIFDSLPRLRPSQILELLSIFSEEERKFLELDDAHHGQVAQKCLEHESQALQLLRNRSGYPYRRLRDGSLEAVWSDCEVAEDGTCHALLCAQQDRFVLPVKPGREFGMAIGIRCVLPLAVAADLDLVEPEA